MVISVCKNIWSSFSCWRALENPHPWISTKIEQEDERMWFENTGFEWRSTFSMCCEDVGWALRATHELHTANEQRAAAAVLFRMLWERCGATRALCRCGPTHMLLAYRPPLPRTAINEFSLSVFRNPLLSAKALIEKQPARCVFICEPFLTTCPKAHQMKGHFFGLTYTQTLPCQRLSFKWKRK